MIDFINQYLIPAILLGSIYAMGAAGVSLLFSIMRFAHFAHGDMMSLGAYLVLFVMWLVSLAGLDLHPLVFLPIAMGLTAAVAIGIDRYFYKPFRKAKPIIIVIASFGIALMIRSLIQTIWGVDPLGYVQGLIHQPIEWLLPLRVLGKHVHIIVIAVVLIGAMHYLLSYTRIGKAMRAMSDDPDLARVTGIDTERVVRWTWVVAGCLAAAGGFMLGYDTELKPSIGWDLLLPVFAAAILGGLGKPYGAIAGGLIIGGMEELSTYPWIGSEALVAPNYKTAVAFGVMVVALIFRPQGLFRGKVL
jgi:branched-chain amino acid transport system permease protein